MQRLRERARQLKLEALALGLAARHPHTPWYAKLVIVAVIAYVVTPVDLVPDFVPLVGFIDDLIFVPAALAIAVRFVPRPVLADCRGRALEIAGTGLAVAGWRAVRRALSHASQPNRPVR